MPDISPTFQKGSVDSSKEGGWGVSCPTGIVIYIYIPTPSCYVKLYPFS
jgi:hypothetical protein